MRLAASVDQLEKAEGEPKHFSAKLLPTESWPKISNTLKLDSEYGKVQRGLSSRECLLQSNKRHRKKLVIVIAISFLEILGTINS